MVRKYGVGKSYIDWRNWRKNSEREMKGYGKVKWNGEMRER